MKKERRSIRIENATPSDLGQIRSLLCLNGLPLEGLDNTELWIIREGSKIVATTGIEMWSAKGLLRSVAVKEELQSLGLGTALVEYAIVIAKRRGLRELLLISESAASFFQKFGFEKVDRNDVRGSISNSPEFGDACPESAAVMRIKL